MNDNETEFPEESRIDREAAEWVAKRAKGLSAKEQDAFFDWLAANPRHSNWYARHLKMWKQLDQLAQWKPEHSDRPNQDLLKYARSRFSWAWFGGIAAAMALLGVLWFAGERYVSENPDETPRNFVANGYERHVFPDGSIIEMNRGAALMVDYSPEERRIELVSSEAHFDVAKDPERPFIVSVMGVEYRAIGTAFNVKLTSDSVELLVTEGRVRVSANESKEASGSAAGTDVAAREVVAGQLAVSYLEDAALPSEVQDVSATEFEDRLAWKPLLLEFDEAPLSEVIEEFNRRNEVKLQILDPELRNEPIVAQFHSANVEYLVELLDWTFDIKSKRIEECCITLYKP